MVKLLGWRRAESAARQILWHQKRQAWIERKTEENEKLLARFLSERGKTFEQVGNYGVALVNDRVLVIHRPSAVVYEQDALRTPDTVHSAEEVVSG